MRMKECYYIAIDCFLLIQNKISDFKQPEVQSTVYICRRGLNVFEQGTAYRYIFFDELIKDK